MQTQELSPVRVEVEPTFDQEQARRNSFISGRLAELALLDHDELDFDSELPVAA